MRKLMLLLIAFIAVVTFIRAFDRNGEETLNGQTVPLHAAPLPGSSLQDFAESGIGN